MNRFKSTLFKSIVFIAAIIGGSIAQTGDIVLYTAPGCDLLDSGAVCTGIAPRECCHDPDFSVAPYRSGQSQNWRNADNTPVAGGRAEYYSPPALGGNIRDARCGHTLGTVNGPLQCFNHDGITGASWFQANANMGTKMGCTATRYPDLYFHHPGDWFMYIIEAKNPAHAVAFTTKDERNSYIVKNHDRKFRIPDIDTTCQDQGDDLNQRLLLMLK